MLPHGGTFACARLVPRPERTAGTALLGRLPVDSGQPAAPSDVDDAEVVAFRWTDCRRDRVHHLGGISDVTGCAAGAQRPFG
jgi:hypothetical protein